MLWAPSRAAAAVRAVLMGAAASQDAPAALIERPLDRVLEAAVNAIHAQTLLRRDVDYLVRDNAIELVDEFKGRVAQNRRWPAPLQTAIEAKEGVPLQKQGRVLGQITLQSLINMYPVRCGMTGTAATQADEG